MVGSGWTADIRTRFLREIDDCSHQGRVLAAKTLEFRSIAVTRADEGNVPRLSVMIRLTEPDPHLLTKSKERSRQESNRDQKKSTSSVFVLQMEERAQKSYN